jgi:two-component system response regulator HydG
MNTFNVLVLDDDVDVCRMLNLMLPRNQYEVQMCHSIADALDAIEQKPFDIYLMDYKLPDGSGLDAAQLIRSKWADAPIIILSGYEAGAIALKAGNLRISDFLEKPFSRETICNAMKKAVASLPLAAALV